MRATADKRQKYLFCECNGKDDKSDYDKLSWNQQKSVGIYHEGPIRSPCDLGSILSKPTVRQLYTTKIARELTSESMLNPWQAASENVRSMESDDPLSRAMVTVLTESHLMPLYSLEFCVKRLRPIKYNKAVFVWNFARSHKNVTTWFQMTIWSQPYMDISNIYFSVVENRLHRGITSSRFLTHAGAIVHELGTQHTDLNL